MQTLSRLLLGTLLCVLGAAPLTGQPFTRITDTANPIVTTTIPGSYEGTAWVDYDDDGDLDLFATTEFLFRNEGGGAFSRVTTILGNGQPSALAHGVSWADVDNDGHLDMALAGNPSAVYFNNGDGTFRAAEAVFGLDPNVDNIGWTAAWGDYTNDGFVDLLIVNPAGFLARVTPCHLLVNLGDGRFAKTTDFDFTQRNDAYTVGTWSDFDDDGDLDLFIGSGQVQTADEDNLYRNMLVESGTATLEPLSLAPLSTDLQDGQVWNLIDIDNDRDLDAYLTNYGSAPDRLYRNNGDGSYTRMDNSVLVHQENNLGNNWGDLDNDGDLDVIITNESGNFTHHYLNNGDGTFTAQSSALVENSNTRGASLGDYDNDGDLDVFIIGPGSAKALYRNDLAAGNHWLNISLRGSVSNRAAIGAKVWAKAVVNGQPVWQRREVLAQNGFNSHNSLRVHFGLGDAATIDTLRVQWPQGGETVLTSVAADQFLAITETIPAGFLQANFRADRVSVFDSDTLTVQFSDLTLTDPAQPVTGWEWDFDNDGTIDATEANPSYTYSAADTYAVRLRVTTAGGSDERLRDGYVQISGAQVILDLNTTAMNLGQLPRTATPIDTSFFIYNRGSRADSITVAIDPGNVTPPTAVSVSPAEFVLAGGDSQAVTFSVVTQDLPQQGAFFRPTVQIASRFNSGERSFQREILFRVSLTGIGDGEGALPTAFALDGNYPNPFNPSTTIRYALPEAAEVTIAIFNARGERVRTLVRARQTPGFRSALWDGRNDRGEAVSSGVYLYRMSARSVDGGTRPFSASGKMVLLK